MGKRNNRRKNKRKPPRRRTASPAKLAAPPRRPVRLRPLSWEAEPAEDQAVFDDQALANLDPERTAEVLAVRESLQLVSNAADDAAWERLSGIPRRSPLSDWRILVRGLTDWYADRFDEAAEIWRRLDVQRRPSRIARALLTAGRKDLQTLSPSEHEPSLDEDILAAARRVRKTWLDRPALEEASQSIGFATPSPPRAGMPPMHLSGRQLDGLLEFSRKYREVEPALVADLQAAALERAFLQPYDDVFTRAQKALNGPAHDPANLLLRFHYYRQFSDAEDSCEIALKQFLSISLPQNQHLSTELAAALRSCIDLVQARRLQSESSATNLFSYSRPAPAESEKLEALFRDSLQAYPANPRAHRAYVDWIRDALKKLYADKEQQQRLEAKLRAAMEHWSESLAEEIEPRLWLVDEYLEEESLELAEPHVQWLAQSRHADPRVRIIPWKWEMLEAMRLSRRKTWLSQAAERLDAAEAQWPSWLSQTWLPYLRAALTLRSGKRDDFAQQRAEISAAHQQQQPFVSPLADAVMMLAAAQRMRVPAADLKPLRAAVDAALDDIGNLSIEELISAGSFFWDLHRIQLLYPAYRMHGKKFADALKKQLQKRKKFAPHETQQPLWDALFWISERHAWNDGRSLPMPACLSRCKDDARYAAATAHHLLGLRNNIPIEDLAAVAEILRAATASEQDVYYRYWYDSMAQRLEQEVASLRREQETYRSNPFFNFSFGDGDDDDDWSDDEEDEDDEDGDWFETFFTSSQRPKPTETPPDPEIRRRRPKNPLAKKRKKKNKR